MPPKSLPPWLPFVLPFALLLLLSTFDGLPLLTRFYPFWYFVKALALALTVLALRRRLPEARPGGDGLAWASLVGVLLFFVWIFGDAKTPHFAFLGSRAGYDPLLAIADSHQRMAFYAVRFLGLAVLVPIAEELFYRGFLLRWVINPDDFRSVPLGKLTPLSVTVNVLAMALTHPEWLVAGLFSLAMCLLLSRTKNLFACILAHGATNLMLGVYILQYHAWAFW